MKTIKYFISFCVAILMFATGFSQSITGKITDNISKGELPGVKVVLKKNGALIKNATSNYLGEFTFSGFAAGKYVIELTHSDCDFYKSEEIDFAAGESKKMDFVLSVLSSKISSYSVEEVQKSKEIERLSYTAINQNAQNSQTGTGSYVPSKTETPFPLTNSDITLL